MFTFTNNSFTMHNGLNWIKFLDKGAFYLHLHCICTANHWKTQMHENIIRIWKEWRHFIGPSHYTDMGFTSFPSSELTKASIVNAVDKKLANPISVHYGESNTFKIQTVITDPKKLSSDIYFVFITHNFFVFLPK